MVRLASRTQCPPNGFQFVDAPISHEPMQTWDFESLVQQVAARRAANPRFKLSTDINTIRAEVDLQNALRVLGIPRADGYVITDGGGGPAPNRLSPPALRRNAGLAGVVKRMTSGAGALLDWLGAGGVPVNNAHANARGEICARCPKNDKGDWKTWFSEKAAETILAQLEIRKSLNLATPYDEQLNVCSGCGCPLKLKVHVPLEHIERHTPEETRKDLDPGCWILAEIQSKN